MPIASIVLFFTIFIVIVLVGFYILFTFYNKRIRIVIDKFILEVSESKPIVFQNIKLRFWTTYGLKTEISLNNRCDLYLFDNCLAIVRRQDFIFKLLFAPILLTSDVAETENIFNYLDTYYPKQITFTQIVKGEVEINLTDPTHKHYQIAITLKELTIEQITQLEKIKNFY
jgi:hypothetical protein